MINIKNWNAYNRLKPVVSATRGTILANPVAAGAGLAAGGVWGLATSNEGRGPLGNAAFWAPVGLAVGVGAVGLRPHMARAAAQSREVLDFLQRAPKSWKGSAANSSEIQKWVAGAQMAAKSNPGMGPLSTLYQGFTGTPDSYLARGPKLTNDEMVGRAYGFLRSHFGIAGEGPLSAAQLSAASPDVPEWLKTSMSLSADLGLSKSPRVGMRTASAEKFVGPNAKWDWESIVGMIETHGDNPNLRGDFLRGLGGQMRSLSEGWAGGLTARDIGNQPSRARMNLEFNARTTADMLESQGQRGLARQVRKLHSKFKKGVSITGIVNREISQSQNEITGLLVQMADLGDEMAIELDVPNAMGIIRHGRYGQNIHVPRNIIDVRSIKALYDGSLAKNLKPRLMDPTSFVLQNLKSYYEEETGADLVDWLKRTYQRATSWETQPYRSDRAGLESAHAISSIERGQVPLFMRLRAQSAMVALPTNETGNPLNSVLKRIGIPVGESGPLNFMGQLQGTDVPEWLSQHGLFTTASENQARNATFSQAFKLLEYDPGMIENPLSKASILERDVAKPYRLGFNEALGDTAIEAARKVAWVPFASAKMRSEADAYEQGFLLGLNPVFESEANLMRKLAFERNRKTAFRVFRSAGIDKSKWRMLYSNIAKIGEINEGVIATATPKAIEMAGSRLLEFDLLNKSLLGAGEDYRSLIGKQLGQGDFIGLDIATGEMIGHTYTNREQGRATITDIMTRIDPKTKKEKIIARIEERYPGAEAKVGTAASKSYMKNIQEEAVPEISKLLNFLRGRVGKAGHARMYANQPILPVLSSLSAGGSAVAGFALQSTMYKFQNRFSTLFNNLLVKHMPEMTKGGQFRVAKQLRASGVSLRRMKGGMFEATFKGQPISKMEEGQAIFDQLFSGKDRQGLLRRVYTSMYNEPSRYFRSGGPMARLTAGVSGGRWSFPAGGMKKVGWKHIQAFEMMTGQFASAKLWDTLENNIPGQASITMHELESLQQYGLKNTWNEILGRGKKTGEFEATRKMFGALAEMGSNRGFLSDQAVTDIGLTKFTLDDVSLISKIDPTHGFRQSADMPWRGLGQFGDNFVVDLTTAHGTMENAGRAVQEALGTSRIFVPGTRSDIWGVEYVLPTGRRLDTEAFIGPLENTLKNVSRHFADPRNKRHLVNAQRHYRQYLSAINDMSKILYTGRGGGVKDASGLWATGRLTYRPYRSIYGKALGQDLASSVVGLSPKKYGNLTRKLMRETGTKNLAELVSGGHAIERGGQTFLVGNSIRYPITDAGPVLFAMDKSLRRGGIGMEETYRYIKNADFDGDSIVCRVMMDKASVSELFGALADPNSQAFKKYHEFLRISDIFGGVSQDVRRISESGEAPQLYGKFMERLNKFKPMLDQDVMERMGKMWTGQIGWYSNLSKVLSFMTDMPGLSDTERAMRARMGMELQQLSIDFGRAVTAGGGSAIGDPSALARVIGQAWQLAGRAPASAEGGGNELMRSVFRDLGFFEKFSQTMKESGGTQADIDMLERLTQSFFSTVTPEGHAIDMNRELLAERSEFMDSLLKRGLRREKLEEAMGEFINDQRVRAAGGEAGWLHVPGKMPRAGEMLSEANAYIKQSALATSHILKDVWQRFRGSPEAKAAGTVLAGAGLLAAGIGLMSSPTEYQAPGYGASRSASAIMRSPDVAMAGSSGEAPLPGSRGGHVASSLAPTEVPRYTKGVHMQHKRFYYDQSNRTPRTTSYAATTPEEASFRASEQSDDLYRSSRGGMNTSVNVVNSPSARRYSRSEMRSRVREDLYR